ncbi:MAG: hypothetical protein NTV88_00770 [Candidatus Micrarchaeota archaeon]|nr:hypothetical protein [Candidatus Micrarchaeota archaeon]
MSKLQKNFRVVILGPENKVKSLFDGPFVKGKFFNYFYDRKAAEKAKSSALLLTNGMVQAKNEKGKYFELQIKSENRKDTLEAVLGLLNNPDSEPHVKKYLEVFNVEPGKQCAIRDAANFLWQNNMSIFYNDASPVENGEKIDLDAMRAEYKANRKALLSKDCPKTCSITFQASDSNASIDPAFAMPKSKKDRKAIAALLYCLRVGNAVEPISFAPNGIEVHLNTNKRAGDYIRESLTRGVQVACRKAIFPAAKKERKAWYREEFKTDAKLLGAGALVMGGIDFAAQTGGQALAAYAILTSIIWGLTQISNIKYLISDFKAVKGLKAIIKAPKLGENAPKQNKSPNRPSA